MAQHAYQVRLAGTRHAIAQWQAARKRAAELSREESRRGRRGAVHGDDPDPGRGAAEPDRHRHRYRPGRFRLAAADRRGDARLVRLVVQPVSCLDPLWAHESGWSVSAYNAGSGAFGIPQALPGSRMASAGPDWQADAATQIRWGLEYIKGTYGSPCGAWGS